MMGANIKNSSFLLSPHFLVGCSKQSNFANLYYIYSAVHVCTCNTDDWVMEHHHAGWKQKHAKELSPTRLDLAYRCLLSSTYKVSVSRNRVISCRRDNFLMNWRPGRGPSNRQNTFTTSFNKMQVRKRRLSLCLVLLLKVTHEHICRPEFIINIWSPTGLSL